MEVTEITSTSSDQTGRTQLVHVQKKEDFIGKSLDKLKETSTDVLQGTQLLAIDVGATLGLLRRSLIGDELTEKEKKAVRRALTDLASVVPIGVLMLLPKNTMIGGALTGAIVSAATNSSRDKIVMDAIAGGAIAAEFLNYMSK